MTLSELLILLVLIRSRVNGAVVKRDIKDEVVGGLSLEKSFFGGEEERNLEREILRDLNQLSSRQQREIFDDLEKQSEKFNVTQKSLQLSEMDNLSPLGVEELKNIRKTIKTSNSSLPAIRNKRTLNFLLTALVRAMGYTLTPTNPDAEWVPRQQSPSASPCTPPPPCGGNPPSTTPPPCAPPPSMPPCRNGAQMQIATASPYQIEANTIRYPFRPSRTIPLFNFAPLPQGIQVPYPPLLQPQRAPCSSPPAPPAPSAPPCGSAPSPKTPPPCSPTPAPCTPTPAPPPPCNPTPAQCGTPKPPPCATTPAPPPPPCPTTPAPLPPCASPPAPKPPPCPTTPAPPPPCGTAPAPPPPPPSPPSTQTPKKGSILLEYDDPVRIQIFSNDKKYLPVSGNIYKGHGDEYEEDLHSYFYPVNNKKKDEDVEEEEEEEHIEAEEEEGGEGQENAELKHHEEEDERRFANDEEDESETNLSVVKKPADNHLSSTAKNTPDKPEKRKKIKKPKRKKWVRIVKKQRKKTKTDSSPREKLEVYSSDSIPEGSQISRVFGRSSFPSSLFSQEENFDFDSSGSQSNEHLTRLELQKVTINEKEIDSPHLTRGPREFELDINPYAPEPEAERRKKLEKAVERYVEDYIEKQLGEELVKNTGVPKTTVFEFTPKNGPRIQTVTTTVAKTSHTGSPASFHPRISEEKRPTTRVTQYSYEGKAKRGEDVSYETFGNRS